MERKTFFVTDAHLGSGTDSRQREMDLVRWLESIEPEAERVIMLGDIFDFWFTYKQAVPRGFVRLLGKMAQMADNGVEFHFFIGNHDMWMFDYLEKEIGVVMHNDPCNMVIGGKQFLIGHGDGLWNDDKKYNFLKRIFRSRFNQWLFAGIHPNIGFPLAHRWSDSSRKSHSLKDYGYLGDEREGIYLYCKRMQERRIDDGVQPYDFFLFGHRHTPICRPLDDALYVNVGNWIEHRDYAIFDGETVTLTTFPKN
ncbi:MAG: UDP-2,3-diacylglucosamine diphosphatase [Bacteroidales bacterium]|nr:UDP-2,3-diacylglucosamine diphosphatase [Bacteroidales bacterium]